ncbi:preprotein translocase subunit YajC [Natranaerobius thermophilus]|uniref:Preprotein translocase, YajC subunit n=1 Tax=Natranaerobius thermophilus (strain ATCC BAA-1301 / DSM 18059 / JW/NM-WN-LF) TaxID=457570 RepID=B2A5K7_NATTJ|nr:preprotein translocase subunit YajC [Natranaerobius thermophilus]ACB85362.1 preprotein translocase, YajC subunit [Natranaerobius thermophilus JW/NM-WN-LF]
MPEVVGSFLPLIILIAIFYFLLIRPQQKQQRERQEMLDNLKKNDKVITIGGIHGTIKDIKEDQLTLKIAENLSITMSKFGIQSVVNDENK